MAGSEGKPGAAVPRGVLYSGLGLSFALTIGLCAWLGIWLDGRWGSAPWGVIVGALLGFAIGTWELVKVARKLERVHARRLAARREAEAAERGEGSET